MFDNKYLREEKKQSDRKKRSIITFLILAVGLSIGGFLIYKGIVKPDNSKIETLKVELENKRQELSNKGIQYDAFTTYTDGEKYDLKIITEVLNPNFEHCSFSEYKENILTKEYCAIKNSTKNNDDLIIPGVFICFFTIIFANVVPFMISAFLNPSFIEEQAIEMASTVANVAKEMEKEIEKNKNR